MNTRLGLRSITYCLIFLSLLLPTFNLEDDVRCLQGVLHSLTDSQQSLRSWIFTNTSVGFVCHFSGVSCWNDPENRIFGLNLQQFGVSGTIPNALRYCRSLQTLQLANNSLSGSIPSGICDWLPYLVTLDLSNNDLTGEIPASLANCTFLNELILDGNRLTGSIPYQISSLGRLTTFSVANNRLSGRVPTFNYPLQTDYEGNSGLCGRPLGRCRIALSKHAIALIAEGLVAFTVTWLLAFCCLRWHLAKLHKKRTVQFELGEADYGNDWAIGLRAHKFTQVTFFLKPIFNVKFGKLLAATNCFSSRNVFTSSRTGTTYRALFPDGSVLAIKRLSKCKLGKKQFKIEMETLGRLRHPHLVPLLGFCFMEEEKFLVYKHFPNGTLSSALRDCNMVLDWPVRFRIALGAATGLAWLQHRCKPPIFHQNINSDVVLLDEDFNARIIDSGLARILSSPEPYKTSYVSADVFGFGVVLLELATGFNPHTVADMSDKAFKGYLVNWVNRLADSGRMKDAIDKRICGEGHDEDIVRFLRIACNCVAPQPTDRLSMYRVYEALKSMSEEADRYDHDDEFPFLFGKQEFTDPYLALDLNQSCLEEAGAGNTKKKDEMRWEAPAKGWFKLNIDVSVRVSPESTSTGGLLRDDMGGWCFGFAEKIDTVPIEKAELVALRKGLELSWNRRVQRLEIETVSEVVYNLIISHRTEDHPLHALLEDCRKLLHMPWVVKLQYIRREKNECADILARLGHQHVGLQVFEEAPFEVLSRLKHEQDAAALNYGN